MFLPKTAKYYLDGIIIAQFFTLVCYKFVVFCYKSVTMYPLNDRSAASGETAELISYLNRIPFVNISLRSRS